MNRLLELPGTLLEVWRVLQVLPRVESVRRAFGPRQALAFARQLAEHAPARDDRARRCVRRAIHWVDRSLADGGNCYRRALLEAALDRSAAEQPFIMGFSASSQHVAGHAWLHSQDSGAPRYDFVIQL
jgi:hypothetical protein